MKSRIAFFYTNSKQIIIKINLLLLNIIMSNNIIIDNQNTESNVDPDVEKNTNYAESFYKYGITLDIYTRDFTQHKKHMVHNSKLFL